MGVAQICEGHESPSNCIHLHNQEGMFWVPPIKVGVYQREAFSVAGLPPGNIILREPNLSQSLLFHRAFSLSFHRAFGCLGSCSYSLSGKGRGSFIFCVFKFPHQHSQPRASLKISRLVKRMLKKEKRKNSPKCLEIISTREKNGKI